MIDNGMNVARLNFSHGDHEGHGQVVKRLKEAFKIKKNNPVALLLDTKGPEIRTGLVKAKQIHLVAHQELEISKNEDLNYNEREKWC